MIISFTHFFFFDFKIYLNNKILNAQNQLMEFFFSFLPQYRNFLIKIKKSQTLKKFVNFYKTAGFMFEVGFSFNYIWFRSFLFVSSFSFVNSLATKFSMFHSAHPYLVSLSFFNLNNCRNTMKSLSLICKWRNLWSNNNVDN